MPSIFTRIINGEIPGRIIWRDDTCVAMIDIRPLNRGHVLVIPVTEVDQWTDLPAEVVTHCTGVAHAVGRAQKAVLSPARIGLMVAGFEVPHTHLHVVPLENMSHLVCWVMARSSSSARILNRLFCSVGTNTGVPPVSRTISG